MSRLPHAAIFVAGLATSLWPAVRVPAFVSDVAGNVQTASGKFDRFALQSELNAQTTQAKTTSATATPKTAQPSKLSTTRADTSLYGTWRVTRGVIAPWVPFKEQKELNAKEWVGQTITFDAKHVVGPSSLKCADAHYEATSYPADALFQGGLKAPVKTQAQNLGFAKFPVVGTSLNCTAGLYEFHKLDATTELVAINNVVWTLDRSPGAVADAASPAGFVQRFLEAHFSGDMGFDAAHMTAKAKFMTPSLMALSKTYFAKPVPKGDAPDIEGDPFTNSQDNPTRFSVGAASTVGPTATVGVKFYDAYTAKVVNYKLLQESGAWHIDDVNYDAGPTFRNLLSGKFK
ncbi:MAG: hypothetical protein ABJB74_17015 [Gemmatimonas sp.]